MNQIMITQPTNVEKDQNIQPRSGHMLNLASFWNCLKVQIL